MNKIPQKIYTCFSVSSGHRLRQIDTHCFLCLCKSSNVTQAWKRFCVLIKTLLVNSKMLGEQRLALDFNSKDILNLKGREQTMNNSNPFLSFTSYGWSFERFSIFEEHSDRPCCLTKLVFKSGSQEHCRDSADWRQFFQKHKTSHWIINACHRKPEEPRNLTFQENISVLVSGGNKALFPVCASLQSELSGLWGRINGSVGHQKAKTNRKTEQLLTVQTELRLPEWVFG